MKITVAALAKGGWGGIVPLAERYARMQFDAAPLRLFSLVIGVNCKTHTLRFLIFHRGGLTASREIELDEQEGRCAAQQVLSSILLWQKAKDAVPSFTNGVEWVIPSDDPARPIHVDADEVLFQSSSVRGRGTVVLRVLPREEECDLVHIRHLLSRGLQQMRCRPQTEPLQTNRATTTATWSCEPPRRLRSRTAYGVHEIFPTGTEPAQYYHDAPLYLRLPNMIGPARTVLCSQNPRGVVLKSSWPDRKKLRIEAEVYASCNGQFGVPDHLLSFEACRSDGAAYSNSIFLPPKGNTTFASYRWYPFDEHDSAASPPDHRTLQVTVIADKGESLEHCESAKDLSMCVLHAQLGENSSSLHLRRVGMTIHIPF
ncbi:hypothetical protein C8Q80DRAFT_373116 [Daedaleopsis nitida]|nr:hypothetical protein C8Q80DRAFT_373116 [Daedaleopsis nitida]